MGGLAYILGGAVNICLPWRITVTEETSGRNLTDALILVFGKWLENPESPYVWAPLGLCILFFVVFIPTGEPLTLYAGLAFGIITLGADWIGRRQNRELSLSAGGKRQIKEGTDRYMIASDIREEIKNSP